MRSVDPSAPENPPTTPEPDKVTATPVKWEELPETIQEQWAEAGVPKNAVMLKLDGLGDW